MPISPLSTGSTTPYVPMVTVMRDLKGGLADASLPEADGGTDTSITSLVYSAKGLAENKALPTTGAIYLKDTNGDYFSVDAKNLRMVAAGADLNLYVFTDDQTSAEKYTFDAKTGRMRSDEPQALSAAALSAVEVASKRDLNDDGTIGALMNAQPQTDGVLEAAGSLFQFSVKGQTLYAVGAELAKAKGGQDIASKTLLKADGSAWTPEGSFVHLTALSSTVTDDAGKKQVLWSVYATDAADQVTEFKFDAQFKLDESAEPKVLSAKEFAALEKSAKRDLNLDKTYGITVESTAIDAKTGLYKGSVLGQDFYLVGDKLKTGDAKAPTELQGALLTGEGAAWAAAEGFTVAAMVKNSSTSYSVYAYKTDDKNTVLRYDFNAQAAEEGQAASGDYAVTEDSAEGVEVSAADLAAAEKLAKADLNKDEVFGVSITAELDKTGGLYTASALGHEFILAGKALASSKAKPLDLTSALQTADGEAWKPEDVESLADRLRIVKTGDTGYQVYVLEDSGVHAKYTFGADFRQQGDKVELSLEDLAAAEKLHKRDLNGDSAYGVKVTQMLDPKGGLYIGSFEDQTRIYLGAGATKLGIGSAVASKGVDLSIALTTDDGYWDVDEGYAVTAAYTDTDGNYVLIAAKGALDSEGKPQIENSNDLRQYTFSRADSSSAYLLNTDEDKTGAVNLFDLTALENSLKRDLNGDGVKGVKVKQAVDKVGGLQLVEMAGAENDTQSFLVVGKSAAGIKDLSNALRTSEGAAWAPPEGESVSALLNRDDGGYELYTVNGEGSYLRHSFKADLSYDDTLDDNGKVLSLVELSDVEARASRKINDDNFAGAQITRVIDKTGGLYEASIGGSTMTLVSASAPGKATGLGDKVLLGEDGTSPWAAEEGEILTAVVKGSDGGYEVYAVGADSQIKRYRFDNERVFSEVETLSAEDLIKAETGTQIAGADTAEDSSDDVFGRDLNLDKAVGMNLAATVDKKGALYQASLLDKTFFVVGTPGTALKTGKTGATAIDLSKALLDADGQAWAPDTEGGWTVAGMVVNKDQDNQITSYDVYTYLNDAETGEVASVQKNTWSASLEFQGTTDADLVALVEVEKNEKRDLSGDSVVGFRKLDTPLEDGYAGVTEAKVAGSVTFFLAGANLKAGTANKALSIKDALLTDDGSAPWRPEDGFKIKSVDNVDESTRHVYAANEDGQVWRYSFDRATGKVQGEAKAMTAVEMAAVELARKRDLSGDAAVGVATLSTDINGQSVAGLFKATMMNQDYLVVGKLPSASKKIDLSAALVAAKDDGSVGAWAAPEGFTIKGVYQPRDSSGTPTGVTEIYGTYAADENGKSQIVRFQFQKQEADNTLLLIVPEDNTQAGAQVVKGVDLAKTEATAGKDLNGDSAIGFKVSDQPALASQSNGFALSTASVATPEVAEAEGETAVIDSPTVYIVGKSLNKMGTLASNLANNAALFASVDTYWAPGEGETVKSLVQTSDPATGKPDKVSVYTAKDDGSGYVRYDFGLDEGLWTLTTAVGNDTEDPFTSEEMVAEEALTKRDLNGDSAVGLLADTSLTGLTQASIDSQTYYMVDTSTSTRIASGTDKRPLDLTHPRLLLDASGEKAWQPADQDLSVTSFEVLTATTGPKYKATLSDDSVQYFDATFKATDAPTTDETPPEEDTAQA